MSIPVIVIDDTAVKRRGICEFVNESPALRLAGQAGNDAEATALVESAVLSASDNPTLANWLVLSDLRLGHSNGIELGRALLEIAPDMRVVIYTQEPGWTLATEIMRREYTRRGTPRQPWYAVADVAALVAKRQHSNAA